MKKSILLLAGICLLAIITAGCGNTKPASDTPTVTQQTTEEKMQAQVEVINPDIPATPKK